MARTAGLAPFSVKAVPLAQRSVAAGSIGASYSLVGSIFSAPVVLLMIVSSLDEDVQISWDGSTDAIPVLSGSTLVLDFKTDGVVLPGNYGVYVKEIGNPTSGSLYVGAFST